MSESRRRRLAAGPVVRPPFRSREDASEVERILRSHGYKAAPRRVFILELLHDHEGHFTAPELLEEARRAGISLDSATLYRTLGIAEDEGFVARFLQPRSGETQYEWVRRRHFHLVCRICGANLELLTDQIELASHGPETVDVEIPHVELTGICSACASAGRAEIHHLEVLPLRGVR